MPREEDYAGSLEKLMDRLQRVAAGREEHADALARDVEVGCADLCRSHDQSISTESGACIPLALDTYTVLLRLVK